jgi:hypothetical protein
VGAIIALDYDVCVGQAEDIFDQLMVKPNRAKDHIIELSDAIDTFMSSNPYVVASKDNSKTGERTYYVHFVKKIPPHFPAVIGDVIHNLGSSLDHLANHLVSIGPGGKPGGKRAKLIYFPLFESATKYDTEKMGKIEGMGEAAINAIDRIQPYKGGYGWALWDMHTMHNRDKHRLLIPVWGSLNSHSFPKSERIKAERALRYKFPNGLPRGFLTMPGPNTPPFLKDGGELLTIPISEVEDHMDFRINIAFGDPMNVRGKEVVSTLDNMHRLVMQAIVDFSVKGLLV